MNRCADTLLPLYSHLGIEPRTFGLEVQRAILCANGTGLTLRKMLGKSIFGPVQCGTGKVSVTSQLSTACLVTGPLAQLVRASC